MADRRNLAISIDHHARGRTLRHAGTPRRSTRRDRQSVREAVFKNSLRETFIIDKILSQ